MTQPELLERARGILAERLNIDPSTITPDSDIESLGADSLDIIIMAKEFEETFGVTLSTSQIKTMRTVGDVILAVSPQLAGRS